MEQEIKNEGMTRFYESKKYALQKIEKEFWYDFYMKDPEALKFQYPKSIGNDLCEYLTKRGRSRYKYIMFTVNPREGTSVELFNNKIEKCLKKVWIKNYIACIEVRNERHEGMHCHIRVEVIDGKYSYDCKREVYNTFKHLVDHKLHVNARYSNREGAFVEYVKGFKKGTRKSCWTFSEQFRGKHSLPSVYQ